MLLRMELIILFLWCLMIQRNKAHPCVLDEEDTWNLHFSCVCKTRRSYSLSNITNALSLIVAKKFVHITFKYCTHLPIILDHVNFVSRETKLISLNVQKVYHLDLIAPRSMYNHRSIDPNSNGLTINCKNVSIVKLDCDANFMVLISSDMEVGQLFINISLRTINYARLLIKKIHGFSKENIFLLISSTVYPTSFPEYWGQKKSKDFYNTALGLFIIMLTLGSFGLVFIALKIFRSSSLNNYRTYSESFLRSLDVNELLSGIMCQSRRKNNNVSSPSIIQNTSDFVPKDKNKLTHEICVQNTPFSSKDMNATSFFTSVLKEHS
ncbi:uncharacterized protein [Lepeophtheirus salmonis]|uniref:uncharacterized protein isoform X1 n=1 Tax=Lepeophtheirus salmonis TaxID=72036 RepID=UPI001AE94B98|nr:uncharacterized protein LOC121128543 isoform X1 [Lepeophtheirus salmonis]